MAGLNAAALAKIGSWMKRFNTVASPQFKGQLTKDLSNETLKLVDDAFQQERSPYGKPWAPKKETEKDDQKILERSGDLRESITAKVTSRGSFKISSSKKYGAYHNEGRKGPWDITPKKKGGRLKFFSGGQWWSMKKVVHPGYPARPFMPSADRVPARWIQKYTKITQGKFFRVLAKGRKK